MRLHALPLSSPTTGPLPLWASTPYGSRFPFPVSLFLMAEKPSRHRQLHSQDLRHLLAGARISRDDADVLDRQDGIAPLDSAQESHNATDVGLERGPHADAPQPTGRCGIGE